MNTIKKLLTYEELTSFEELYKSHKVARKCKRHKYATIEFENNLFTNLSKLENELKNGTYQVGKYKTFYIYEPKKREIQALGYKDRIVQHSLCDNFLIPYFDKRLIYANCACRIGKGTFFARKLLKKYYVEFYKKYKTNGYVLKCDIRKYFANIDHQVLKKLLDNIKDKKCVELLHIIIDSYHKNLGIGLPIGNQVSQIMGVVYLDKIDRLIKEKLHIKYYVRYMDDLVLISSCKQELKNCLCEIKNCLLSLKLELNNKTNITPLKQNLEFLGAIYHVGNNGKIYLRVKPKTKVRFKRAYNLSRYANKNSHYKQMLIAGMKGHLKGFDINLQKILAPVA